MKKENLHNIKQSGFKTPDNYFNTIEDQIMSQISLEKIDKNFIEQFDFVLVPTSMYGKLTEFSVDVVSNFASFSEMSRAWFDLYMQSRVFKTAPFVYLVNRYDAYPTYDNKVTVLDYPLKEYEAIHMRNCPLFKNHYRGVGFFWYEAVRYPSEFFEFIGKRLD